MEIDVQKLLDLDDKLIIDLRTKKEFENGNILNSINFPILSYDERKEVSIEYNNGKKVQAYKLAIDYANSRLLNFIDLIDENEDKNLVLYCSRGGLRSKIIYDIITNLKFKNIYRLKGGYKSYRRFILNYFDEELEKFKFITIHGLSGVGKTNLLKLLENEGLNVLNYADIAKNTGSAFGNLIYKYSDVSQKNFDDQIFKKLYYSDSDLIFTESESKRLGTIFINNNIYQSMVNGKHILLRTSLDKRVKNLYNDYVLKNENFNKNKVSKFVDKLRKNLGNKMVNQIKALIFNENYEEAIEILLVKYYDKFYDYSIKKYKPFDLVIEENDSKEIYKIIKKECLR